MTQQTLTPAYQTRRNHAKVGIDCVVCGRHVGVSYTNFVRHFQVRDDYRVMCQPCGELKAN